MSNRFPIGTRLVEADGMRFEVLTCGEGPRFALCLHGFPEHAISWRYQLPLLAELGYTVWAPNLRGYGRTTRPRAMNAYALPHLIDDVSRLIDAAGARSTLLLGHDWGGVIAWYYGAYRPRPLDGLVQFNAAHPLGNIVHAGDIRQWPRYWYMGTMQVPGLAELIFTDMGPYSPLNCPGISMSPEVRRTYLENVRDPGALTAMTHYYRALALPESVNLTLGLFDHPVRAPSLVFCGCNDMVLHESLFETTRRAVRGATLVHYPALGHWVNQEEPHDVNRRVAAWLSSVPAAGAAAHA